MSRRQDFMRRLSLWVPRVIYDRLEDDSRAYGITKTAIVQTALINYYRRVDNGTVCPVDSSNVPFWGSAVMNPDKFDSCCKGVKGV